jgi:hypothetical protein
MSWACANCGEPSSYQGHWSAKEKRFVCEKNEDKTLPVTPPESTPPPNHCRCGLCGQIYPAGDPHRCEYIDQPQPDTCCECGELAVGFDEGSPYCAAHYQSRQPMIDARAEEDRP